MPKHAPKYLRRREKPPRNDRAITIVDGKRHYLGVYGSPESYKRFGELVTGESKPDPEPAEPAPTAPTVNVLMAGFLKHAIDKYGGEKSSEVWHFKAAIRVMRETCGPSLACDYGPKAFQRTRAVMVEAGWSRRYVNDQCQRVKRIIAWGVIEELLPPHARHALDAVPGLTRGEHGARETEPVEPVPDKTVDATLTHLGDVVADMVRIARHTGMRPGEVCQLADKYIDRSGPVWLFTPPQHKTLHKGKGRAVAIGPKAQGFLQKYLFQDPCFGYTTASFRRAIHRACDRAWPAPKGMKGERLAEWQSEHRWCPNQLRHTRATEIRKQFGLEHAQVVLGHSKADVTQIYAEKNVALAAEVALASG